ncbi:MAG: P-II family nitrogen regulator [Nitrososphaeraceae archaeon]|nr:P-II family nitrogen regulator [Nitrososphaeraceae archaeon]
MNAKSSLPFELVESEKNVKNQVTAGLKKIEIFVSPEKVEEIISEIESLQLEATVYDSHGYGQSKQRIRSGKAGGQTAVISTSRKTIVTIAESDVLGELIEKLKHLNDKSEKKIGVISIQPVDALVHL